MVAIPVTAELMQDASARTLCQNDLLDPARATALARSLGLADTFDTGSALLPFFHHIYFWDAQTPAHLGRDGHPKVGGLIPDMGLPRRMWAGGRIAFHHPLRAGVPTQKTSTCEAAVAKTGRSGPLGLVTLRHEFAQEGAVCVTEWQDLIYRAEADPDAPRPDPPTAPQGEDICRRVQFDTTMLFRYSALTFNGHRIHYDHTYAREVEGYDGLVVHGPLLAQMLMLMAVSELGALAAFQFRATAPLMDHEAAELCLRGNSLWVRGPDGRQCMTAEATPASE